MDPFVAGAKLQQEALVCPRDGAALAPFTIDTITIDRCHGCGGLWLDAGEMRRITHDAELEALASAADHLAPPTIECPRCGARCYPSSVEGVALDTCLRCSGVWLDKDELRDARTRVLVRRSAEREAPRSRLRQFLDRIS